MSSGKDYLSQEEIDALLRQASEEENEESAEEPAVGQAMSDNPQIGEYLSAMEQDALGEIGNITFGSAATALSTLLGRKVDITTPKVDVISKAQLHEQFPKPHVAVHVDYVEGFHGINMLVIKTNDAQIIADLMMGGDGTKPPEELNEIHISAVQEAMNQMMGSSATSMSTIFNRFVNISPPGIDLIDLSKEEGLSQFTDEGVLIKVSFRLTIGDLIDSTIMQLLPVAFAKDMVDILMGGGAPAEEPAAIVPEEAAEPPKSPPAQAAPSPSPAPQPEPQMAPPVQDPFQAPYQQPPQQPMQQPYQQPFQQPMPQMGFPPPYPQQGMPNRNVNVQPVQFTDFNHSGNPLAEAGNLNLLLDIPLRVTVELGRTQKQIKEILELSQGSIVELDKLAGEPVDILVNNKLIAKGEVVVIDENFGVRVTDIISQWDRMQKIQ